MNRGDSVVIEEQNELLKASTEKLLFAAYIGLGSSESNAKAFSRKLRHENLDRLSECMCTRANDKREFGLGPRQAVAFAALIELGRRNACEQGAQVLTARDVWKHLSYIRSETQEHVVVLVLDSRLQVSCTSTVHKGTIDQSIVGPREIFRIAVKEGAASIIVAHNHPSGDPEPSPIDIQTTRHLARVGADLGIPLMDHIIIGKRRFVSLRQRGVLQ